MTARHAIRKVGPVIMAMIGPADSEVRSCIFCARPFAYGDDWLKIGFPHGAYIGAHVACSQRKDAELAARRAAQH